MFGREALLEAQRAADERQRQKSLNDLEKQLDKKKAFLGTTIVNATIDRIEFSKSGVILRPSNKHGKVFNERLVLGDDFNTSKLTLKAHGDVTSGWMGYELRYFDGSSMDRIMFFMTSRNTIPTHKSDTNIVIAPDDEQDYEPVVFESPEYHFVRNVGGLFLLEILKQLKEQGL